MILTNKNILVTGGAGYIGSVLIKFLLEKNANVIVADNLLFGGESLLGIYNHPQFTFYKGDLNEKEFILNLFDKHHYDAIIHLAAIVGDPACGEQTELAKNTNLTSSKQFYNKANEKNISRFIFASTCSNYGKMSSREYLDEHSILRPISLYAELKVEFEKYILSSKTNKMVPTILRFSTAYGLSPRMRFDLTVNEFIRDAVINGELLVFGKQFWRPYCHVNDLARSIIHVIEAEKNKVNYEIFNVGDNHENYQKEMIVNEIKKQVTTLVVKYIERQEDPRDYRVNTNKIKEVLEFNITKTVPDGICEIAEVVRNGLISEPFASRYKNSK